MAQKIFINPPFRAEHLGSLLRPAHLLELRKKVEDGDTSITAKHLREAEDEEIRKSVELQRKLGIKGVTDGEFRKGFFTDGFFTNLTGAEYVPNPPQSLFKSYVPSARTYFEKNIDPPPTYIAKSKLKREKPMYRPDWEFLASLVPESERKNVKIDLCPPDWYHIKHGENAYEKSAYTNDAEYFADIVKAYREEFQDLYDAGCRYIQFDLPMLTYFCDQIMREGLEKEGVDPEKRLDEYIKLYNGCIGGRPDDLVVGVHLCRGNNRGVSFMSASYELIAKKVFQEVDADSFFLEFDTEHAGGFEPLRHLPPSKTVVLGLVSPKTPVLEDPEVLKTRIMEAAKVVGGERGLEDGLNRLSLSPACGFASHSGGNLITPEVQQKKLALVVDTAREVWPDA